MQVQLTFLRPGYRRQVADESVQPLGLGSSDPAPSRHGYLLMDGEHGPFDTPLVGVAGGVDDTQQMTHPSRSPCERLKGVD